MRGIRRQVVIVLLGVAAALAVIVVRLLVDARSAYRNGAAAEERGEISEAIRYYLDAGRLYVPGSPFTRNALDRLDAIGVAQVTKGDYATARAAFEAERAALLGTRSFYTPYAERLPSLERGYRVCWRRRKTTHRWQPSRSAPSGTPSDSPSGRGPRTSMVLLALLGLSPVGGLGGDVLSQGRGCESCAEADTGHACKRGIPGRIGTLLDLPSPGVAAADFGYSRLLRSGEEC